MLYYLFKYLDEQFDFPGAGLFQYLSFRALMAASISLLVAAIFGKYIILFLRKKQIGETIRDLGLQGQMEKKGTPTMGGLMIIAAILLPVLLVTRLDNIYIVLLIITTLWMGFIGFLDDYIKIFKKNKEGLQAKFKLAGQITLGIGVGLALYFHPSVVVRKMVMPSEQSASVERPVYRDQHSTSATIPFLKNNELDYAKLFPEPLRPYTWLLYVAVVTFIITAISNGANITDGIDGLAAGTSAIIGTTLGVLAYVSGNLIFSNYLNIMYLPNTGEVLVFCTAFVGACIGFLWYNSYPAQVFMGDTGSLPIGAIIAVIAIMLRKELLIPILCGIFIVENLSVVMQVAYFKYTKKKYGEGRRIFLMSPLHHHYQKKQIPEPKIVTRFWIVGILLAIFTIATLKIR